MEWYEMAPQWISAIGTVLAVIVALFSKIIRDWYNRPKINMSCPTDSYVDMLKDKIDNEDRLFVVDITHQKRQGWLPSKAWDWIKANDI